MASPNNYLTLVRFFEQKNSNSTVSLLGQLMADRVSADSAGEKLCSYKSINGDKHR